jgi:hypothetical protein
MKKLVKEGEINQYTDTCNCIMNTDYYNQMSVYNDKDRLRDHSKLNIRQRRYIKKSCTNHTLFYYHCNTYTCVYIYLDTTVIHIPVIYIYLHSERGRFY